MSARHILQAGNTLDQEGGRSLHDAFSALHLKRGDEVFIDLAAAETMDSLGGAWLSRIVQEAARRHASVAFGNAQSQAAALRLIALYHWAKATELLAVYMLQGQPVGIEAELDKHFEAGRQAASAGQDAALEVILRWLHVTSRRMVAGSLWKVAQHERRLR